MPTNSVELVCLLIQLYLYKKQMELVNPERAEAIEFLVEFVIGDDYAVILATAAVVLLVF